MSPPPKLPLALNCPSATKTAPSLQLPPAAPAIKTAPYNQTAPKTLISPHKSLPLNCSATKAKGGGGSCELAGYFCGGGQLVELVPVWVMTICYQRI